MTVGATIDTIGKDSEVTPSPAAIMTVDLVLFAKPQLLHVTGDAAVHLALIVRGCKVSDDPTFKALKNIAIWDSEVHWQVEALVDEAILSENTSSEEQGNQL